MRLGPPRKRGGSSAWVKLDSDLTSCRIDIAQPSACCPNSMTYIRAMLWRVRNTLVNA